MSLFKSLKKFLKKSDEFVQLIEPMGYCLASDKITVDGEPVGYMYREEPDNDQDSGWRFLSGTETQEYLDDPKHLEIYDVNTIANYDREIIPFLEAPFGSAFERAEDGLKPCPPPYDDEG